MQSGGRISQLARVLHGQVSGEWKVIHRSLGGDLYGGTSGIGVFLARLFALTGEKVFRNNIRAAIERALSAASSIFPAGRIGFYSGTTGWLTRPSSPENFYMTRV